MQIRRGLYAAVAMLTLGLTLQTLAQTPTPAPPKKPQTIAEKIAANKEKMDLNTATAAQLKSLPGMGDNYVARIIAGRPYTAKNQLVQRGILPADAYASISDLIVAHRPKKK
ncbi:MAG TPA: helix-hairpin-helix domain-containing protein [Acidobacteriaceae bacterium]